MTTGRIATWEQWDRDRDRNIQPTPRRQEQVDQARAARRLRGRSVARISKKYATLDPTLDPNV